MRALLETNGRPRWYAERRNDLESAWFGGPESVDGFVIVYDDWVLREIRRTTAQAGVRAINNGVDVDYSIESRSGGYWGAGTGIGPWPESMSIEIYDLRLIPRDLAEVRSVMDQCLALMGEGRIGVSVLSSGPLPAVVETNTGD